MIRPIAILASLVFATAAQAQEAPSMGPSDMKPNGPFSGTLPHRDASNLGAGLVVPKSDANVSVVGGTVLKSGDKRIHDLAEQRRADALKLAGLVSRGQSVPPEYAAKLREAIDGDMELWRDEYRVSSRAYKEARKQWLEGMAAMDSNTLAVLRSELFTARDAYNAAKAR